MSLHVVAPNHYHNPYKVSKYMIMARTLNIQYDINGSVALFSFRSLTPQAIDEGRLEEDGAAGSIAELSRLVFAIIPHEKAEAVTLVRRARQPFPL